MIPNNPETWFELEMVELPQQVVSCVTDLRPLSTGDARQLWTNNECTLGKPFSRMEIVVEKYSSVGIILSRNQRSLSIL